MRKVEPQDSGKFKVRFRMPDGTQTSRTFRRRRTVHGQLGADDFARLVSVNVTEALRQLNGSTKARTTPSLNQVAEEHIRHLTGIEDGTRLNYTRLWKRTWGPLIGTLPADTIDKDTVARAVNDLAGRYSEKSLKNQRGLLAAVLDRAVEKRHLALNPAKGVRLPTGTNASEDDDDHEMVLLTHDDWAALHAAIHDHYKPFVRFLVGTGARWGEAVVLRRRDVDPRLGTVKLRRALKWSPDGNRKEGTTKTKKSKRTVALPAEVLADLLPLLDGKSGDDLVFTSVRGKPIDHRHFWSGHWRPALWLAQHCSSHRTPDCKCGTAHPERCKAHKTPPAPCGCDGTLLQQPRLHDLRHTHASWLLGMGVPIHVVQARLGHESIQTTVDTYGHLLPDAQLAAAQAASYAFTRPTTTKELT